MKNNQQYSMNETSAAWGIRNDLKSTRSSLKAVFELINEYSDSPLEVTTPGPSDNTFLRVIGRIPTVTNNGHLILNNKGVDLRIAPGKITAFRVEERGEKSYRALFYNSGNSLVIKINFCSSANVEIGFFSIHSIKYKLRPIDTQFGLEKAWRELRDVHHFYPMLQQFGINKLEAFNSVPDDLAYQVDPASISTVLLAYRNSKEDFMIFVGNESVFHVYTGPVTKIHELKNKGVVKLVMHGRTYEGEKAIFKIATSKISQAWVVNKFSEQGSISSLEIFDNNGNHVAQFNGLRKEGMPQRKEWKALIKRLPKIV